MRRRKSQLANSEQSLGGATGTIFRVARPWRSLPFMRLVRSTLQANQKNSCAARKNSPPVRKKSLEIGQKVFMPRKKRRLLSPSGPAIYSSGTAEGCRAQGEKRMMRK